MSNRIFPPTGSSLTDKIAWNNTKELMFSTLVQQGTSGKESRVSLETFPRWRMRWRFRALHDTDILGDQVNALMAFYAFHKGGFESFLVQDTQDYIVANEPFGIGNAAQTEFQLVRTMGGLFTEPIYEIKQGGTPGAGGLVIKKDTGSGLAVVTNWTEENGIITFDAAVEDDALLTWSATFYYRVRFEEDELELEQLLTNLWTSQEIVLVTVKP